MPLRLELFSSLRAQCSRLSIQPTKPVNTSSFTPTSSFSTSSSRGASTVKQRQRRQDPYRFAQARARKAANITRQDALQAEREKARGDSVRGVSTPFVESFDTARPISTTNVTGDAEQQEQASEFLNYFVSRKELERSIEHSSFLVSPSTSGPNQLDPMLQQQAIQRHEEQHNTAAEALRRITAVENTSSKDRTRINVQRCIETFGRHNTDGVLRPKPKSNVPRGPNAVPELENTPRAGPDTGSSEVQIAVLTAKIRALANSLDSFGNKDKMNKRNLRLLVHRRQKLLQYLRRKEKGGERWQHLIKTLGLTEATWKGEISL